MERISTEEVLEGSNRVKFPNVPTFYLTRNADFGFSIECDDYILITLITVRGRLHACARPSFPSRPMYQPLGSRLVGDDGRIRIDKSIYIDSVLDPDILYNFSELELTYAEKYNAMLVKYEDRVILAIMLGKPGERAYALVPGDTTIIQESTLMRITSTHGLAC